MSSNARFLFHVVPIAVLSCGVAKAEELSLTASEIRSKILEADERYRDVVASGEYTRKVSMTPRQGTQAGNAQYRLAYARSGDKERLTLKPGAATPGGQPDEGEGTIVTTPGRLFHVSRDQESDQYQLVFIGESDQVVEFMLMSYADQFFKPHRTMRYFDLVDMLGEPEFKVKSVVRDDRDPGGPVRVEFERAPSVERVGLSGWFELLSSRGWVLSRYHYRSSKEPNLPVDGTILYASGQATSNESPTLNVPFPEEVTVTEPLPSRVVFKLNMIYDSFEAGKANADDFSLASYGFQDFEGGGNRPLGLGVWLFIAAVVLLIVGITFRRLSRRFSARTS